MDVHSSDRLSIVCFFMLGIWVFLPSLVVMWTATEDILAGSTLSTTVILVSFSVPDILSKVCSPLIVNRIPFICSMIVQSLLSAGSLVIIVLVDNGVVTLGFAYGYGIITCLRMAAYFDNADDVSSAFVSGSTLAATVASIGYTGKAVMRKSTEKMLFQAYSKRRT